jgi:signal transduction histidine kinase
MKCPRCQQENLSPAKFCPECGAPRGATPANAASYADLHAENERLRRDLAESLEQQTATAEILRVISSSPTDVQPVFEAIIRSAVSLCGGIRGSAMRVEAGLVHLSAHFNMSVGTVERLEEAYPREPTRHFPAGRAIVDRAPAHVFTEGAVAREFPGMVSRVDVGSILAVPLLREGKPIGALSITRTHDVPFTERQIALVQTFADQAVIAIENVRLFKELEARNRDLTESLEQQTATSEILRVISSSPTSVEPVFAAVAASAARLCDAYDATIHRTDADVLRLVAHEGPIPPPAVLPLAHGTLGGRTVRERRAIQVADMQAEAAAYPESSASARSRGFRTILSVPLLCAAEAIGTITIRRTEVRPFTDRQTELLKTFADQAVIAIENVRLFHELQARNRHLTEALERQTATGEILRVISSSPTNLQPVFDAIVHSAGRLCDATFGALQLFDGEHLTLDAQYGISPEDIAMLRDRVFPMRPDRGSSIGRAIISRSVVHIDDIRSDPEYRFSVVQALEGYRTVLSAPMLRGDRPVGVLNLWRKEVRPFSATQIDMVKTFADQAVIAIENVRLFKELQARNRDLSEALDRQTATADILRALSQAQTDVQPVFDTIVRSAAHLCHAVRAAVFLTDGRMLREPANYGGPPEALAAMRARYPRPVGMDTTSGMAVLTRSVVHVPDTEEPSTLAHVRQSGRMGGFRSCVTVPMMREGQAVGAILVARREPGRFSDVDVALLKTFADQAVIAVENARLLTELQARTAELTYSVAELTALGEVGRAVSSTLDLETVLQTIVSRAVQIAGTAGCTIWEYDEPREEFRLRASHYADERDAAVLHAPGRVTTIRKGQGMTTQVMEQRQPVQIPEITAEGAYESPIRGLLIEAGHRALLGVPLLSEDQVIGVLAVTRKTPGAFEPETVRLLSSFATQSALAIQNARLFREIEDKSRQLEAASQHKSEFLANMSHELRTPLNAIIGFSEVLTERMFGELNEKQEEYLKDIHASGQHLLSLINDILDLSKIEAGRMELELADFDLPQAIDNALTLIRERAGRRGIALHQSVEEHLGEIRGDERKVKQVLLNLLSNALKFTPEGGRVELLARVVDGMAEISVTDTGVGIAAEDQEAVFEEFRQVGTADKKVEGTGLGLALSRRFVELHGGRIWVKSQVGQGSTFTFTLPVGRGE